MSQRICIACQARWCCANKEARFRIGNAVKKATNPWLFSWRIAGCANCAYDDARRWMQAMYATPSGGKPLRCEVQSISPRHSMI